ncbi:MAG: DUF3788 family protein [Chitinophagaceae bacterium]|nr:DUF3788 family protein [Chitinophagaceae bacterium]
MGLSIFIDKKNTPSEKDLVNALGDSAHLWQAVIDFVYRQYPRVVSEWNYSGEKYGWCFRIKDKKRAIVYLLPRNRFFKVAMLFGGRAFEDIKKSSVSEYIKTELEAAKVYTEGRRIRLEVKQKRVERYFPVDRNKACVLKN